MSETELAREIVGGEGLSLSAVAKLPPVGRGGKPCHVSAVHRWVREGIRAVDGSVVRLEAVRLGGRWLTSTPAVRRFLARLQQAGAGAPAERPARERRAADAAADRALATLGI